MKSVMVHKFSEVPRVESQRSQFDRSHGHKLTFDGGNLVPIYVDEALPGDSFNLNMTAFARLNTPVLPVMDNIKLDTFFFAVPLRLIWDNWPKFCGEQKNPSDSIDFTIPTMQAPAAGGHLNESLSDYLGIPTKINSLSHSSLFHRAYNFIWNEWFRDQNLQNSVTVDTDNGPDTSTNYTLLKRGKRHDYFTSSLPWLQKGTSVALPLGTSAPLSGTIDVDGKSSAPTWKYTSTTGNSLEFTNSSSGASWVNVASSSGAAQWDDPQLEVDLSTGTADLSTATAASVNQLREAFQVQKILERDARAGSRYVEILESHFGVTSPDARAVRPIYLGGGTSDVNITPIAQTSSTDATTPQGNLAAMGTAALNSHGFVRSFTEHCIIIGLVSARADLTYQQGLERMYSRATRYDFYWPSLAHLGEQSVLNKEIYAKNDANDDLVFGYQERYAEYRYKPSRISGKFRSNDATSLDGWHLSQEFSTLPTLGDTFIQDNPPLDRVVATPAEPHFMMDCYFNLKCARPMPVYGVPGYTDRF